MTEKRIRWVVNGIVIFLVLGIIVLAMFPLHPSPLATNARRSMEDLIPLLEVAAQQKGELPDSFDDLAGSISADRDLVKLRGIEQNLGRRTADLRWLEAEWEGKKLVALRIEIEGSWWQGTEGASFLYNRGKLTDE